MRSAKRFGAAVAFTAVAVGCPADGLGQPALERFSLDSAVGVDLFRGENTADRPNIVVDVSGVVRIADGWMVYVRPWLRQPRAAGWDKQIYQAALQYARAGDVSTQVDLGYIASPIGLGMMDTRPGVNPTILPHLSYFSPMPAFEAGAPRVQPLASTYPLGGQVTLSGRRWDTRGAVVDAAPTRVYVINGARNPRRTPAFVAGLGVTPQPGLRVGLTAARGRWAARDELAARPDVARTLGIVSIEGEYSFGYTKLAGEVTRDSFRTATRTLTAYAWFVQGAHTLSPRWFVAGRQEGVSSPPATGAAADARGSFHLTEATVGYRLARELTLRGSLVSRKSYSRAAWDQQVGASLVWAQRWR